MLFLHASKHDMVSDQPKLCQPFLAFLGGSSLGDYKSVSISLGGWYAVTGAQVKCMARLTRVQDLLVEK